MCLRCCGRDHFGKCVEEARCFVCAGKHEESKHECTVESCGKRSEPCEHYAPKCANCQGSHQTRSKKCPERRLGRQNRVREQTEIRSSPPVMEMNMEMEQDDLLDVDGQTGTETMQSDQERTVSAEINASPLVVARVEPSDGTRRCFAYSINPPVTRSVSAE
jgi:hypothetical protein